MARDPVCGMNVKDDRKDSLRSEFRGQNYFFCSDKCQKEFDRNPQNFVRDNRDDRNQNVRNDNRDNNRDQRQGNRDDLRDDRRPR